MNLNLIGNLKVLLGSCLILQYEIFGGFSGISFRLRGEHTPAQEFLSVNMTNPRISSYLLKKSLMENFIFCAVKYTKIRVLSGRDIPIFTVNTEIYGLIARILVYFT